MLINKNNVYIEYNYKNIIPFNLKKNLIRVHGNLIGIKKLRSFILENEKKQQYVKTWYHYLSINNLKKCNTILEKKYLDRKLSVFFISNFNIVESKWIFPIVYKEYYDQYIFMKKKNTNLLKNILIYFFNYKFYFSNLFTKKLILINKVNVVSLYYVKYIYFLLKNININFNFNIFKVNDFLSLKTTNPEVPIFWIRNIRKQRNLIQAEYLNNKRKIFFKRKEIAGYNIKGFFSKFKKKNEIKKFIKKIYIKNMLYLKNLNLKWKKGWKLLLRQYKLFTFKIPNLTLRAKNLIIQKLYKQSKLYKQENWKKEQEEFKKKQVNFEKKKQESFEKKFQKLNKKRDQLITEETNLSQLNIKELKLKGLIYEVLWRNNLKYAEKGPALTKQEEEIQLWKKTKEEIQSWKESKQKLQKIKSFKILKKRKLQNKHIKTTITIKKRIYKMQHFIHKFYFNLKQKKLFFEKNKIVKFIIWKKIWKKLQLLKLLNEIKLQKNYNVKKKISLWFYKIFIIFKYLNIIKKKKEKKNLYNFLSLNLLKKQKKMINLKKNSNKFIKLKKKWILKNFNSKIIKLNFFIEKIYKKANITKFFQLYNNYFSKLKIQFKMLYKNKFNIIKKIIYKYIYIKKNILYNFLILLQNYINNSKLKELNLFKEKWNKTLFTNKKLKYWLKKNKRAIFIIKKIYKNLNYYKNKKNLKFDTTNNDILFSKNLKLFKFFSIQNYDYLFTKRKDIQLKNIKLYKNIFSDIECLYFSFLKNINIKKFSILKNINERKYSIFLYFLKYKEGYLFNNYTQIKNILNYKKKYINNNLIDKKQIYKRKYLLQQENKLIINLFKEFILGSYEEKSYMYYNYLGTFKKEIPLRYTFKLTKTMKIKADLWTSPRIIHSYDPVLIELRTLKIRRNDFWMNEKRKINWKNNVFRFRYFSSKDNKINLKYEINKNKLATQQKNLFYIQYNKELDNKIKLHMDIDPYLNNMVNNFVINLDNNIEKLLLKLEHINSLQDIRIVKFYLNQTNNYIKVLQAFLPNNNKVPKNNKAKNIKQENSPFKLTFCQENDLYYYWLFNQKKIRIDDLIIDDITINNIIKVKNKDKIVENKNDIKMNKELKRKDDIKKYKIKKKDNIKEYIFEKNKERVKGKGLQNFKKSDEIKKGWRKYSTLKEVSNIIECELYDTSNLESINISYFKSSAIIYLERSNFEKEQLIKKLRKKLRQLRKIKFKIVIQLKKQFDKKNKEYAKNIRNTKNHAHFLKILNLVRARNDILNKTMQEKVYLWNILQFTKEKKILKQKKKKILKIRQNKKMLKNRILNQYVQQYWNNKYLIFFLIINLFYNNLKPINSVNKVQKNTKYKHNFIKSKYCLNWVLWIKLLNYKKFKYRNKKKKIRRIKYIRIQNNIYKF